MRVQHHLTIILTIAVVGAIGLAAAVGSLLGGVERAAREAGRAADRQAQVDLLVTECEVLLEAVTRLSPRSSEEAFAVVDRGLTQSALLLGRLRHTAPESRSVHRASDALEQSVRLAAQRSGGVQNPDDLERLRESTTAYAAAIREIESAAAATVLSQQRTLARRRRVIMLTIGVICFIYLALIERARHWTTLGLIDPMKQLADAAAQVMEGAPASPRLEHAKSKELRTLASMLTSYADNIESGVQERTAEVVRQKEALEQEVRVRRRAEEALRYSSLRDKLTGLCNRDLFVDRLERCFERSGRRDDYEFAVLSLDIDQFQEVQDRLGQVAADQLLISLAERLRKQVREAAGSINAECSSLARLGGDEFVVLLDGVRGRADASLVADRIRKALVKPVRLQGGNLRITASIGIAFREDELDGADQMLRNAEVARYIAKAGGKGCTTVYKPGMHDQLREGEEKIDRLRRAMQANEFTVSYQPIVDLRSGRLKGFEALARWEDPQRGSVSPVEFIADAEQTGVIIELGRWVLEQACGQMARWRRELPDAGDLTISVNVSRQQLVDSGLVEAVQSTLRTLGLEAAALKLEVTESVIMNEPDAVAETLRRLKAIGVEIHMDDFGTGYSSLAYLHRLPIDVLKIDRAFMSSLSTDTDYADVVHTVVALARTLSMGVTVEGVETEDQLAQIRALDCDFGQGYYFSRPLACEPAAKLITSRRRWLKAA